MVKTGCYDLSRLIIIHVVLYIDSVEKLCRNLFFFNFLAEKVEFGSFI